MREPIRRRRKSKDWMLTYGVTTVFVVGSLWYLDLLPIEKLLQPSSSSSSQTAGSSDAAPSTGTKDQLSADQLLAGIEQYEPDVEPATDFDFNYQSSQEPDSSGTSSASVPAAPASFAREKFRGAAPTSGALPFPPVTETADAAGSEFESGSENSLSEEERIARIFGGSPTPGNRPENNAGESEIIPASAVSPNPGPPLTDDSFVQIDQWIAEGQYLNAHRALSQRYWKEEEPLEPLLARLNKTAGMIYFAPQPHFMQAYEVQPGDLLQSVAPQYKISWEYLARLNRVRPERIRAGQQLKVIKGPFSAFVDLSDFSLTVHAHGYFVKRYAIGIGKDNSTPIGTFSVKEKLVNPKYYGTDAVIEADDPANPLGERWIDIGDSYGIHGTIDPESIGKAESRGCLRLTNDDVIEVYDFLIPGSEVVIRP